MAQEKVWALVVAAGRSDRMGMCKITLPLCGRPVLAHTLVAFSQAEGILVVAGDNIEAAQVILQGFPNGLKAVAGGDTRTASVMLGLQALAAYAAPQDVVLIHDGARPLVTGDIIDRCIESVRQYGSGVAALPVTDTIKDAEHRDDGHWVSGTLPRHRLWAMHTPQGFRFAPLLAAYRAAGAEAYTDDAAVMEAAGQEVRLVMSHPRNIKLTHPQDIAMAEGYLGVLQAPTHTVGQASPAVRVGQVSPTVRVGQVSPTVRVGQGYDVHQLAAGRRLVLCGMEIPYERGLLGHSDADVACHALMDAILGALGAGDIGQMFPDNDPAYEGADSLQLLAQVVQRAQNSGWAVGNADITIMAQRPKLAPYRADMTAALAAILNIPPNAVCVKATTTEKLGFVGREEGIAAQAVVLLTDINHNVVATGKG